MKVKQEYFRIPRLVFSHNNKPTSTNEVSWTSTLFSDGSICAGTSKMCLASILKVRTKVKGETDEVPTYRTEKTNDEPHDLQPIFNLF